MKSLFLGLATLAAAATFSARAADESKPAPSKSLSLDDLFPDKVLARGKGFEIKSSQVEEEFLNFKLTAAMQGRSVPERDRVDYEAQFLNNLIIIKLLVQRATDSDKAKATIAIDQFLREVEEQAGGEEGFARALRAQGQVLEKFKARKTARFLADEVFKREVRSKVEVPPDEIKKFYEQNTKRFEVPEKVHTRQILITTLDRATLQPMNDEQVRKQRDIAEQVLDQAKKGEDFVKLVEKYSEDPASRAKGGEYTFARGQMPPEIEVAAFSLGADQISSLITSQYGFHIIKVLDKIPAKIRPLSEAESDIRDYLAQREADKLMPAYVNKLKKEGDVQILDEKLLLKDEAGLKD